MITNDILRKFRYALNINDPTMIEIFTLADHAIDLPGLKNLLKKEDETGYVPCSDRVLGLFLDGFILYKRGKKQGGPEQEKRADAPLNNNAVLRKIRIALELKEDEMIGILRLAAVEISSSELTALFRNKDHKNYKECGDQFLRSFLKGLAVRYREKPLRS